MLDRTEGVARPACLVLHGLGGGPYELAPLIGALGGWGARVATPILPGHDGPGPRMPSSTWEQWSSLAGSSFDDLASGGGPVVAVGFSTGATLALDLATRRPVAALILLAPFLAIRHGHRIPIRPASYLGPIARWFPEDPPPGAGDPRPSCRPGAPIGLAVPDLQPGSHIERPGIDRPGQTAGPDDPGPDPDPPGGAGLGGRTERGGLAGRAPRGDPEAVDPARPVGPPARPRLRPRASDRGVAGFLEPGVWRGRGLIGRVAPPSVVVV